MSELDLIVDREIRKAAASCFGVTVLTVLEVAEVMEVKDLIAALLIEDATRFLSSLCISPFPIHF